MAEETNFQPAYPLAPTNGYPRSDEESATLNPDELRRKKWMKLATYIAIFFVFQAIVIAVFSVTVSKLRKKKIIKLAIYIAIFVVFQAIVIAVFSVAVLKVKTPKVRLGMAVTFQNGGTSTQPSPSFDISFTTQVRVKNTNFGPYKYDSATVAFMYDGVTVGEVSIPKGKAGMLSTKKVSVTVNVNSKALQSTLNLGTELSGGNLKLTSHAKLSARKSGIDVGDEEEEVRRNELQYCTMTINAVSPYELADPIFELQVKT